MGAGRNHSATSVPWAGDDRRWSPWADADDDHAEGVLRIPGPWGADPTLAMSRGPMSPGGARRPAPLGVVNGRAAVAALLVLVVDAVPARGLVGADNWVPVGLVPTMAMSRGPLSPEGG